MTETTTRRGPWEWPAGTHPKTKQSVSAILWTLADLGGSITDEDGRCASKLSDACEKAGTPMHPLTRPSIVYGALDNGAHAPGLAGCIARDFRNHQKRTYKITLLLKPDEMPPRPKRIVSDGGTGPRPVPVPVPEPEQPKPAPAPAPEPEPEAVETVEPTIPPLVVVGAEKPIDLALSLSDKVNLLIAELLVNGATPTDDSPDKDEQAERLAQMIEESNRLRRKVSDHVETIRAKTAENEGLRKALVLAQNNLRTLQQTVAEASSTERNLNRLNGNQRFIAQKPEPAILRRAK
jgi:hypothetical protein